MDEEIERLVIGVRADTQGFARDVAAMQATLDGPFAAGVSRAGQLLDTALTRAIRSGKLGFDDLKRVALSVLGEIAAQSIRAGIGALAGPNGSKGGSLLSLGTQLLSAALGAPGRATGGPVSPGRAYLVGEQGPELFVPTASGSIATASPAPRAVRVAITINAPAGAAPEMLTRSSRQIARAVRTALQDEG